MNIDRAEGHKFVLALLDSEPHRLGANFAQMLYQQTRGNPLFTIEILRGMQERGDLMHDHEGYWIEGQTLDWEMLPARIEAVIAERIGRLAQPLRAALRVASVEGETFTAEAVACVLATSERDLLGRLSRELDKRHHLIRAHTIQRKGDQLLSRYRFRHIQIQKYLYSNLDEVERVYLHEQLGTTLEALYDVQERALGADTTNITPQLARHFQETQNWDKAIFYLRQAGERALHLSAFQAAIIHLTKGLDLLMEQPETPQRDEKELEFQLSLGMTLKGMQGVGTPVVENVYIRARDLIKQTGMTSQYDLTFVYFTRLLITRPKKR